MSETPRSLKAMERLEAIVNKASHVADDPGLRDTFIDMPRAPIRIICCALDKGINHGNILRIAECFRLEQVSFDPVSQKKEQDFSGGFAALHWQPYVWDKPVKAVQNARARGCTIYGMNVSDQSVPLRKVHWKHPAAIVLGQELCGIDEDVLQLCDYQVAIPLYGVVQSLNVAVCAALAVESCFESFRAANPVFLPARAMSKRILENEEQ